MKAMFINKFGGPEVFEMREVDIPEPGPNELLVKVHATSINPVDYKIRESGEWAGIKPPTIIGYDAAGVVEKIGAGVELFNVGDEVFYTPEIFGRQGTYAEYHLVNEAIVVNKPKNLDFKEAASIPLAGCTAWDSLISAGRTQVPDTVLIHGGSGGVGTLGIQIAKSAGAKVITTCNGKYKDLVKNLGADIALDYKSENYIDAVNEETNGEGVDVVFDCVGGETLANSIDAAAIGGRMVTIVNTKGDLNKAKSKNLSFHYVFMQRNYVTMENLKRMIDRKQLKPVIDSTMSLDQVAEAHKKLKAGGVKGKIVIEVA